MKTRKDYEQELTYAIARHADAVERERASKEERMRAHEQLVALVLELAPVPGAQARLLTGLVEAGQEVVGLVPEVEELDGEVVPALVGHDAGVRCCHYLPPLALWASHTALRAACSSWCVPMCWASRS